MGKVVLMIVYYGLGYTNNSWGAYDFAVEAQFDTYKECYAIRDSINAARLVQKSHRAYCLPKDEILSEIPNNPKKN